MQELIRLAQLRDQAEAKLRAIYMVFRAYIMTQPQEEKEDVS